MDKHLKPLKAIGGTVLIVVAVVAVIFRYLPTKARQLVVGA